MFEIDAPDEKGGGGAHLRFGGWFWPGRRWRRLLCPGGRSAGMMEPWGSGNLTHLKHVARI